jgi:D-alanyl-D-alanine dipeptidase
VYDCYRPQRAVNDFISWSQNKGKPGRDMKEEFFPTFKNKTELFEQGFIAYKSGHSRGSTVDLTVIPLPVPPQPTYHVTDPLRHCFSTERYQDNMIDMATGFDCFHPTSHTEPTPPYHITELQKKNRALLLNVMQAQGFKNLEEEWWHYTLINEPFPTTYFDFEVV